MESKIKFSCVGEGVLRGVILTLICLLVYTLACTFGQGVIKEGHFNIMFLIITLISVLYGAGVGAKKAGQNGWIIGMCVGIFYIIIIYIISLLAGRTFSFGLKDICRILLCVFAGTLSGMLGINL